MAEMITTPNSGKRKAVQSLHIDMTPLVDLGFLLITFFIFTATLSEPMATQLFMPADGPASNSPESASLTVLLDKDNRIYYYEGKWENAAAKGLQTTTYNLQDGLGAIIRQKQKALGDRKKELMLMIKPLEASTYSNVINVLDEVQINAMKHYAIMEATGAEKAFVQQNSGT
jgi:biopolymer transport protein ExbD